MRLLITVFVTLFLLQSNEAIAQLQIPVKRTEAEIDSLKETALSGKLESQQELCLRFGSERLSQYSRDESAKWCGMATAQGDIYAQGVLAFDKEDYQTALKVWHPLAEKGNALAQWRIGEIYDRGLSLKQQEPVEALKWYRKSSDQGDPIAPYLMGMLYEPRHRQTSWEKVTNWFHSLQGLELEFDNREAVKWFSVAADRGDSQSASRMARMYEYGVEGLTQDYAEAYFWELVAEKLNPKYNHKFRLFSSNAPRKLPEEYLSVSQKSLLERRADEWKPTAVPEFILYPSMETASTAVPSPPPR